MKVTPDNAQHIGRREEQQDAFGFTDPKAKRFARHGGILAVVADGMGGMAMGSQASKIAVTAFLKAYEAKSPKTPIVEALEKSLRAANQAVVKLGRRQGLSGEVGTTLIAAVIRENSLHWISAGDSRIYLLRDGELIQLTTDHIYANELYAQMVKGKLTRSEIFTQTGLEDLTSYLGLAELKAVDHNIRPFPLQDGDRVLLSSDGLYKSLSDDEIIETLTADHNKPCEALVNRVLEKQLFNQDNVTVLTLSCAQAALGKVRRNKKLWLAVLGAILFALAVLGGIWWWKTCHPQNPVQPQDQTVTDTSKQIDVEGVKEELKKEIANQDAEAKRTKKGRRGEEVKR